MSHVYYIMYHEQTLEIQSISGHPFSDVPQGYNTCKAHEKDAEGFHTGEKQHQNYLITVNDQGYANFRHRYLHVVNNRFNNRAVIESDSIQDLDYRKIFFDYINIKYEYDQKKITLIFDVDNLSSDYRETFIDALNTRNLLGKIFITEYQNTTTLISNFILDLKELSNSKTLTIPFKTDKHISLWGVKI